MQKNHTMTLGGNTKLSMYQLRKLIWNMYDITKEWTNEGLVIPRSWQMLV